MFVSILCERHKWVVLIVTTSIKQSWEHLSGGKKSKYLILEMVRRKKCRSLLYEDNFLGNKPNSTKWKTPRVYGTRYRKRSHKHIVKTVHKMLVEVVLKTCIFTLQNPRLPCFFYRYNKNSLLYNHSLSNCKQVFKNILFIIIGKYPHFRFSRYCLLKLPNI